MHRIASALFFVIDVFRAAVVILILWPILMPILAWRDWKQDREWRKNGY